MVCDLRRAGFSPGKIRKTDCSDFSFEGTYPSEANEEYRSLYVEARK